MEPGETVTEIVASTVSSGNRADPEEAELTHQDVVAHSFTVREIPYQLQFVSLLIFLCPIDVQSTGSRLGRAGRKPRNNRPK